MKMKVVKRCLAVILAVQMVLSGNITLLAQEDSNSVNQKSAFTQVLPQTEMKAEASSIGAGYPAEYAIDGNRQTYWHGNWEGENIPPHTITIDLEKSKEEQKAVKEVILTSRYDGAHSGHESINNVKCNVEVSTNGGISFETVVKDAPIVNGLNKDTTIPVYSYATNIRISGSVNFMSLGEFQSLIYTGDVSSRFALSAKIKELETKYEETMKNEVIGGDYNQFPLTAVDVWIQALADAKDVLWDDNQDSDGQADILSTAYENFLNSKRKFTNAEFIHYLEEAKSLNTRIIAGNQSGNCTAEAKEKFIKAIEEGQLLSGKEDTETLYNGYLALKEETAMFLSSILAENENDSMDISGTWNFHMSKMENAEEYDETVTLPGSMDENKKGNDNTKNISPTYLNRDYVYVGEACYQREITIPKDWDGKNISLHLERTRKTRVWIDDIQVGKGQQKSYTSPHVYDLTSYVTAGAKHTLTIEVDNSPKDLPEAMYTTFEKDFPWGHMVSEHTQTNWNGIIGTMELKAAPAVFVREFKVRPDVENKMARVIMKIGRNNTEGTVNGSVSLHAKSWNNTTKSDEVKTQSFSYILADGEMEKEFTMNYQMGDNPLLWDEFSPTLYELTADIRSSCEDKIYASQEKTNFGMRKFDALYREDGGKQFSINGRPTQLRGEINCAVFPMTGYSPMDLDSWLEVMQIYKDYGLNHVRFHTWTPPKAAFDAASQLGLYVDFELPQWGHAMFGDIDKGDSSAADYYWQESLYAFENYLNYPSAVMMALGNELRPGFYYYNDFLKRCEAIEPELLYTDIAGWSAYTDMVEFSGSVPTKGANYLHRVDPTTNWDHSDNTNKTNVPFLAHEPGQLQVYPDYKEDIAKYYEKNSLLKPRNLELFQKILKDANMEDMAGKFNQSSGKLGVMLYRYMTEGYLRTPGAGGFQLLGLQDFSGQGTALIGMLDPFMESKGDVTPEEFRESCSELTVLGKFPKFVWENDEDFSAEIVIPNYAAEDIKSGVSWSLKKDDGTIADSGTLEEKTILQGEVNSMGNLKVSLRNIKEATQLTLELVLDKKAAKEIAPYSVGRNQYTIWVYPAEIDTKAPEEVSVYTDLSTQAYTDLKDGKNVLIISGGTKAELPESKAVTFRPDFWSPMFHNANNDGYVLGCYIDKEHPVFKNFPTDIYADWQWYDLVSGSRSILLDKLPKELKPIVQVIPTIDLGDRLGSLFEANVENGKLMVCSINLKDKTSAPAKQLLKSIQSYMASNEFAPEVTLNVNDLKKILPSSDTLKEIKSSIDKDVLELEETANISIQYINYKNQTINMPQNAVITYKSSNDKIADVTQKGEVYGVGQGVAEITIEAASAGNTFESRLFVTVGAAKLIPMDQSKLIVTATSEADGYPLSNLVDGKTDTYWHSDYANKEMGMPQDVTMTFEETTEVSALICNARKDNQGGGILKASVYVSENGTDFYKVIEGKTFDLKDAKEDKIFVFPAVKVKAIKLSVEEAVMSASDSNAVAIAEINLYNQPMITQIQPLEQREVRFGTPLEKILKKYPMPEKIEITINGQEKEEIPVVWTNPVYNADQAGLYTIIGIIFKEGIANLGNQKAEYSILVKEKDMTVPANTTAFNGVLYKASELAKYESGKYTLETWKVFEDVYKQAQSFGALTNATQHDTDVMTELLEEAIYALVEKEEPEEPEEPEVPAGAEYPINKEVIVNKKEDGSSVIQTIIKDDSSLDRIVVTQTKDKLGKITNKSAEFIAATSIIKKEDKIAEVEVKINRSLLNIYTSQNKGTALNIVLSEKLFNNLFKEDITKRIELLITIPEDNKLILGETMLSKEAVLLLNKEYQNIKLSTVHKGEKYSFYIPKEELKHAKEAINLTLIKSEKEDGQISLSLSEEGMLSAGVKAVFSVKTDAKEVFVYYYNEELKKLEEIPNHRREVSKEETISLTTLQGGEFVILEKEPSAKELIRLTDKVSAKLSKTRLKKGEKASINVILPKELSLVKSFTKGKDPFGKEEVKISYAVKDKTVASITSNGIVTAKKKGKTEVIVTVNLENKQSKKIKVIIFIK